MMAGKGWLLPLLTLLSLSREAEGEIFHLKIEEGTRPVIEIKSFGFYGNEDDRDHWRSNFTLIIKKFEVKTTEGKPVEQVKGPVGFSLERRETISTARMEQNVRYMNGTCFADWKRPERIMVLYPRAPGSWEPAGHSHLDHYKPSDKPMVYDLSEWIGEGFMALFFFTCEKNIVFNIEIEVIEYNLEKGKVSYLSAGKHNLPDLYFLFCLIYLVLSFAFIRIMRTNWNHVHKIHLLMLLLLYVKATSLFFEGLQWHVIKMHGYHSLGVDIPTYFFLSLKAVMLMVVILLIGTGWSIFKPFLGEHDWNVIWVLLPLQVLVNIATVVVETLNEGNKAWSGWRDMLRLFDIVCCCAILLPVVWSIRNLKEAEGRSGDGKVAKNLARLRQFRTFYIMVVLYIYFTRVIFVLVQSALHWRMTWFGPVMLEGGTLCFYIFVGHRFMPKPDQVMSELKDEDFDDLALQRELAEAAEAERASDSKV